MGMLYFRSSDTEKKSTVELPTTPNCFLLYCELMVVTSDMYIMLRIELKVKKLK